MLVIPLQRSEGIAITQRHPRKQRQEDLPLSKWPVLIPRARGCVFYRSHTHTKKNKKKTRTVHCNLVYTKHRMQKLSLECRSRGEESGVCHGQVSVSIARLHLDIKTVPESHTSADTPCWHPSPLVAWGCEISTCEQVSTWSDT